jgi:uncharacterized membrane protein YeaQ/YmgE (transglycosylase-associated protein family)
MTGLENLAAWIAIGFLASVVAMIWPFRRGFSGIAINAFVGIVGAVAFAVLGYSFGLYWFTAPVSLGVAALGAIAALALTHFTYVRLLHPPHPPARGRQA